jgi:arylsulfatase A-like enzyme
MPRQPNVLLIWTDEQRADTLACYGNEVIQTPHLNALAERSFVFENAYCTQPVCTPSRASILSGLWPHTHGCVSNNTALPAGVQTLAELMNEEYHCAYYGKWHLGDEIVAQHGFEEWVSLEDGPYRPFFSRPEYFERFSDYHHFLVEQGYAPDTKAADGARVFSRGFAAALPERFSKAGFLGQRVSKFLSEYESDRPFLLSANFLEPHMPFFGPLNNQHDLNGLPEDPVFAQPPGNDASLRNRLFAAQYATYGLGGYPLQTRDDWRRVRANYYGLVTMVDNAIGEILRALEKSGQAENTVVVFTSDHGDMMGDHALLAKSVMYQEAIRIPLLMHVPWLENRRIGGQISQIDLVPTLLELTGQSHADHLQGRSRVQAMRDGRRLDEDIVVEWNSDSWLPQGRVVAGGFGAENAECVAGQSWRTLVSRERVKINVSDSDHSELYDLNNDPYEQHNRWDDPRYGEERNELLARLARWQQQTGDKTKIAPQP